MASKYNYITQEQLNDALAAFFNSGETQSFYEFFSWYAAENLPANSILSPTQHAFIANVLTIFNHIRSR